MRFDATHCAFANDFSGVDKTDDGSNCKQPQTLTNVVMSRIALVTGETLKDYKPGAEGGRGQYGPLFDL
jgi:hypothetical protein